MIKQIKQPVAFSLLEILLLVSLVAIAFMGVSSLLRQTVQLEGLAKADFIGATLADEGIELVKAMRKDNIVRGNSVFQDIATTSTYPILNPNYFIIDKGRKTFNPNSAPWARSAISFAYTPTVLDATARLYYKASGANYYYTHDSAGNTATNYYRLVVAMPSAYTVGTSTRFMVAVKAITTLVYRGKTYTYQRFTLLKDDQ